MKKDMPKAQAKISPIICLSKKVAIRGLGLCIFIIPSACNPGQQTYILTLIINYLQLINIFWPQS